MRYSNCTMNSTGRKHLVKCSVSPHLNHTDTHEVALMFCVISKETQVTNLQVPSSVIALNQKRAIGIFTLTPGRPQGGGVKSRAIYKKWLQEGVQLDTLTMHVCNLSIW